MTNHRTTLRLGRLAGVPIGIQPLWLVIVGLLTYTLGSDYFPARDPGLDSGAAYTLGLTDQAAAIGRAFGIGLIVFGVLTFASAGVGGLWLALIGGFLFVAGKAEAQQLRVQHALTGVTAAELMSAPVITVPASATLESAVDSGFVAHLYGALPVIDEAGRAIGLLSLRSVRAIPAARRAGVLARDALTADRGLLIGPETLITELLQRPEFERIGRAVVVDRDQRPVGIVSTTDVQRRVRADELRSARTPDARRAA